MTHDELTLQVTRPRQYKYNIQISTQVTSGATDLIKYMYTRHRVFADKAWLADNIIKSNLVYIKLALFRDKQTTLCMHGKYPQHTDCLKQS